MKSKEYRVQQVIASVESVIHESSTLKGKSSSLALHLQQNLGRAANLARWKERQRVFKERLVKLKREKVYEEKRGRKGLQL